MILHCNYEEITALVAGGRSLLEGEAEASSWVLAPAESRARVEALLPRLVGDVSLSTLTEVRGVAVAVDAIVHDMEAEMEALIELVTGEPADAVTARTFRFPD